MYMYTSDITATRVLYKRINEKSPAERRDRAANQLVRVMCATGRRHLHRHCSFILIQCDILPQSFSQVREEIVSWWISPIMTLYSYSSETELHVTHKIVCLTFERNFIKYMLYVYYIYIFNIVLRCIENDEKCKQNNLKIRAKKI